MAARTWRDVDLRGGHGTAPGSVGGVVARTRLALAIARWGESALFVMAGACLTLAALAASEAALGRWDVWVAAAAGGILCGLAWGLEHEQTHAEVARTLDRRLRHQGGLLTAWEIERRGERGSMARLVVQRVLQRLRQRDALRATFPPLALPIAAPLICAGLLALVLESRRPGALPNEVDLGALLGGSLTALDLLAAEADQASDQGGLDPATAREVDEVVRAVRGLERRVGLLGDDAQGALEEVEALAEELAALAPRVGRTPALRRALEQARNWLDAARSGLARSSRGAEPDDALAGAGTDGTMSASVRGGEGPAVAVWPRDERAPDAGDGNPARPAIDAGTSAESWWPAEYDTIVVGWTEWRRRALDPPAGGEVRSR